MDPDSQQFSVRITSNLNNKCKRTPIKPTYPSKGVSQDLLGQVDPIKALSFAALIANNPDNKIVEKSLSLDLC